MKSIFFTSFSSYYVLRKLFFHGIFQFPEVVIFFFIIGSIVMKIGGNVKKYKNNWGNCRVLFFLFSSYKMSYSHKTGKLIFPFSIQCCIYHIWIGH